MSCRLRHRSLRAWTSDKMLKWSFKNMNTYWFWIKTFDIHALWTILHTPLLRSICWISDLQEKKNFSCYRLQHLKFNVKIKKNAITFKSFRHLGIEKSHLKNPSPKFRIINFNLNSAKSTVLTDSSVLNFEFLNWNLQNFD